MGRVLRSGRLRPWRGRSLPIG